MANESKQKAEPGQRVDEQGGILVGLRLDPALSARRAELTDPARITETEERLHDFAARLDEIEALGDIFNDDVDFFAKKAPASAPEPIKVAVVAMEGGKEHLFSTAAPKEDIKTAEDVLEDTTSDEGAGETLGGAAEDPSYDTPGLRPPGASDFEDLYGSSEETPAALVIADDEGSEDKEAEEPALAEIQSAELAFPAEGFSTIDEVVAERNARISEEVIEISDIDRLPEDAVEDFAWSGFDAAAREGWEAVDDDRDPESFVDPDFPEDGLSEEDLSEDYGALDEFLSRSEAAPAELQVAVAPPEQDLEEDDEKEPTLYFEEDEDAEEFARNPEESLEDVLRDDLWLEDIMQDDVAPKVEDSKEDADVWENPMTRVETETNPESARDVLSAGLNDEDPLAYLDAAEGSHPEEMTAEDDDAQAAAAGSGLHGATETLSSGIMGFFEKEQAAAVEPARHEEAEAAAEPAGEPAPEGEPVPAVKGSRLPLLAASAMLVAAMGFGMVNMGIIPLGSGEKAPSLSTEIAASTPAAPAASEDIPVPAESDPLSQDLAELRDTAAPPAAPVEAPSTEGADQLDRVAKGLEAAAEGDLNDLFLPENAASVAADAGKAPVLTQEMIDGLATDADITETRAAIDRMFSDMQTMKEQAAERESFIGTLQSRMAEIETLAHRAETLALAQNEVIVDVVRLQEQMLTAEELIVDLSRRLAAIEAADPADRVSVDRSLEDLDRRISGLSRDVGLVARMSLNGTAAPLSLPVTAAPRGSEPDAPGAGAIYQDSKAEISVPGASGSAVPAEVKVGDFVDRYGYVLDIVPTSDGSRLVVMENGSVIVP